MAKNTGDDFRKGSVKNRSQLNLDKKNGKFVKRDLKTGEFKDLKEDDQPFKGVTKEPDRRQK
jgi:hypothetical protein